MIAALSYIIAVLITVALAVILYPVAGLFWILGLFGKLASAIFSLTRRIIRAMWNDIRKMEPRAAVPMPEAQPVNLPTLEPAIETWECPCGRINTGNFCGECGTQRPGIPIKGGK
ncbi:MAG: hypothetical protein PUC47_06875 [Oscillospiraceae bacterium]|nr:hypothetical protein [Oscillospiraceae bacterium]